jgi:hypothetical protein
MQTRSVIMRRYRSCLRFSNVCQDDETLNTHPDQCSKWHRIAHRGVIFTSCGERQSHLDFLWEESEDRPKRPDSGPTRHLK